MTTLSTTHIEDRILDVLKNTGGISSARYLGPIEGLYPRDIQQVLNNANFVVSLAAVNDALTKLVAKNLIYKTQGHIPGRFLVR